MKALIADIEYCFKFSSKGNADPARFAMLSEVANQSFMLVSDGQICSDELSKSSDAYLRPMT